MNVVKLEDPTLDIWGQIYDEQFVHLGESEFPAVALWTDDQGYTAIVTQSKQLAIVQSIDLEWVPQLVDLPPYDQAERESKTTILRDLHDTFILTHYNPVCLRCWVLTAETITNEGDELGNAYSIRLVEPEHCTAICHEDD